MPSLLVRKLSVARACSLGLLLLLTIGCRFPASTASKPQDEANARRYIELLRQRNYAAIEQDMDQTTLPNDVDQRLEAMADKFPSGQATATNLTGWNKLDIPGNTTTTTTISYVFSKTVVTASVTMQRLDDSNRLAGFTVSSFDAADAQAALATNSFTLAHKSVEQYTVLALAILSPLFCVYAFILCLKTKIARRKWLWLILIFLGVGEFGVNWTTGESILTPFFLRLPPGGAQAAAFGPWIVYASLPIEAILFLYLRPTLSARKP